MPRTRDIFEHWREAVHRDQRGESAVSLPSIEFALDAIMIGPKDLGHAGRLLLGAQSDISWDGRELADFGHRGRRTGRAIAINDKARIILLHQGGVERI